MNQIYKIVRSIRGIVWLGLFTLLLITMVVPGVALEKPPMAITDTSSLLVKGKVAYESGKFSEANKYWELAVQKYQTKGDRSHQALSLNYLSLANQELGQWQLADKYIIQSQELLKQLPSQAGILGQVFNTQGSLRNLPIKYNHPYYWAPFILVGNWL